MRWCRAATFQVVADNVLLYDSGVLVGGMLPVPVEVALHGAHELRLIVVLHGEIDGAHADWVGARLACSG